MTAPLTRLALGATLLAMAACAQAPAPAPVVAAPPAPPPAAAPAPVADAGQALPIFFEPWSAALDAPAEAALREAIRLAQEHPRVRILVIGYADPRGSREANVNLSRLRARVVADFLAANGVSRNRVRTLYRGPVAGMEGIQSRRVQVQVDRGQR